MPDPSFRKIVETGHYLLPVVKSRQFAAVFKGLGLDRAGLLAFLKNKPTGIKGKD